MIAAISCFISMSDEHINRQCDSHPAGLFYKQDIFSNWYKQDKLPVNLDGHVQFRSRTAGGFMADAVDIFEYFA